MKRLSILFLCLMFITILLLGSGCQKTDKISLNSKEKEKKISLSNDKENVIDLPLYFDGTTNPNNLSISKEERVIKKDEALGELIILELIKGPAIKSGLKPILPKETKLISFSIKDSIAVVNFSKEANVSMTTDKERLCLKSIVYSLTEISSVSKVKFMIENKDTNLWGGNFDLTKPLGRDDLDNEKKK